MANARKRTATAVRPHVNERPIPETGAVVDKIAADNGRETTQSRSPWPAEFGWDFPFDFPKSTR
jgi:hypothetical protein